MSRDCVSSTEGAAAAPDSEPTLLLLVRLAPFSLAACDTVDALESKLGGLSIGGSR